VHVYYAIIVGGRGEDISRRDSEGERERERGGYIKEGQ